MRLHPLELKVPPVVVFLLTAAAMWFAARTVSWGDYVLPGRLPLALAFVSVGTVIGLVGVGVFRRARTTVHPHRPEKTTVLVTTGLYRWSRNPMYLALLLVLLGWGFYLSHGLAWIGAPLFVVYLTRFQIVPEERALQARFGAAFEAYRRSVRRWI